MHCKAVGRGNLSGTRQNTKDCNTKNKHDVTRTPYDYANSPH
ncbi:hypothetical protein T08_8485 [Trichinella sp. T8]|nr:hypothetical protein T08_8485 [Trichinella sp. T8]